MGLQTLDRAVVLLRTLGSSGEEGMRLIDLERSMKLTKPTTHRLLSALIAHGLVARDEDTRRYRLGTELAILGWSVTHRQQDLRALAVQSATLLAEESGDTVVVVVRSGFDTVCIDRRSGAYPVQALTVDVGTRRPLGVGAGGLAILASLAPEQCDIVLRAVAGRLSGQTAASSSQIQAAIREGRKAGFTVSNGYVLEGVRGIAVAIRDFRGEPIAGIGIAAIAPRIPNARVPQLVQMLKRERRRLEAHLRSAAAPRLRNHKLR